MTCTCKHPTPISHWFAQGQNHRANPGDLVCSACGGGIACTPEEYAKVEAADREWVETSAKETTP